MTLLTGESAQLQQHKVRPNLHIFRFTFTLTVQGENRIQNSSLLSVLHYEKGNVADVYTAEYY